MARSPSPAPGAHAGGPSAPPLDPALIDRLLADHPDRAAALIAALRLEHRAAPGSPSRPPMVRGSTHTRMAPSRAMRVCAA